MTLRDPIPGFKVTVYVQVQHLKKGQSYYRTLIGNHTPVYRMVPLSMTFVASDPDFKVTTLFDIEYLRNDTR